MSDPRPPASPTTRWVARLANLGSRWSEGYELAFMEELVRTHGLAGTHRWSAAMMQVRADLEQAYGIADGQLVMAFAAFWQGCTYCSRGHLLASNLVRFRDDRVLFPLDVPHLSALRCANDDDILAELATRLVDHPRPLELLRRQFMLRDVVDDSTDDDALLRGSLAVWGWLSECSIMVMDDERDVPPLSKHVVHDRALHERYRTARATTG